MDNRELIKKIKDLSTYLDSRIEEQLKRPYSEREDIERNLTVYGGIREKYDAIFGDELSQSLEVKSQTSESNGLRIDNNLPLCTVLEDSRSVGSIGLRAYKAIYNCAEKYKINTLKDFVERVSQQTIMSQRLVGSITLEEVIKYFESRGLSLREKGE